MRVRALLPRTKRGIVVTLAIVALIAVTAVSYSFVLAMEAYSARESSKMLDNLESLRIGDPAIDFERAVRACKIEKTSSEYICTVLAPLFRHKRPWALVANLGGDWDYKLRRFLDRVGLRFWRVEAIASVDQGRIQSVTVGFSVDGRYELLDASWGVSEHMPEFYEKLMISSATRLTPNQRRTYLEWFHVISIPDGEGFVIHATPHSTDGELRARHINRGCLFSFRGCDGLCDLLPDAIPVLNERNETWGGCTKVPPSHCELKNDNCRINLQ
jgi:hypothetical protein